MNTPMRVLLRLSSIQFFDTAPSWWTEVWHLRQVFTCVRDAGLWLDFGYYGRGGSRRLRKLGSVEELLEETMSWKPGLYVLRAAQPDSPGCELGMSFDPGALALRFLVSGSDLVPLRSTIIDKLIDLTLRLHTAFHDSALFGPRLGVEIHRTTYPRVRPPRLGEFWANGNAVDIFSKEFHSRAPIGRPQVIEKLLAAPMPTGAVRTETDDLVILRWMDSVEDEEYVAERRSIQEQWFAKVLNPPIRPGYNKQGDFHETPLALEQRPPLTFYDLTYEEGYKAVVLNLDGSIDPELLGEMTAWIQAGQLPDGTPLQHLHVILPSRDSALRVLEQAKTIGLSKVLYVDEEGNLWNPDPPGLWVETDVTG